MKPVDDWMELELWEPQRVDVQLALPEGFDKTKDESAVFTVLKHGPLGERCKVGDIVMMSGAMSVALIRLPNGRRVCVGQDANVAFVMETEDLEDRKKGE